MPKLGNKMQMLIEFRIMNEKESTAPVNQDILLSKGQGT